MGMIISPCNQGPVLLLLLLLSLLVPRYSYVPNLRSLAFAVPDSRWVPNLKGTSHNPDHPP